MATKALKWSKIKFGELSGHAYCSKYYEPHKSWTGAKAWWIRIPLEIISTSKQVYILLEKYETNDDLYCLKVPTSYFTENEPRLAKLDNRINPFLSAEQGHLFQDQRRQG